MGCTISRTAPLGTKPPARRRDRAPHQPVEAGGEQAIDHHLPSTRASRGWQDNPTRSVVALNGEVAIRLVVAFALTYVLGFERQLRGSPAGDRTFSLIGLGAAVVGALAVNGAPNALAGAVTGIGFIGGGLVFRQGKGSGEIVRGVTTAAAIFATAAIGAAAGEGQLLAATLATALVLVSLELQHVSGLRFLDARRWQPHFTQDAAPTEMPPPEPPSD